MPMVRRSPGPSAPRQSHACRCTSGRSESAPPSALQSSLLSPSASLMESSRSLPCCLSSCFWEKSREIRCADRLCVQDRACELSQPTSAPARSSSSSSSSNSCPTTCTSACTKDGLGPTTRLESPESPESPVFRLLLCNSLTTDRGFDKWSWAKKRSSMIGATQNSAPCALSSLAMRDCTSAPTVAPMMIQRRICELMHVFRQSEADRGPSRTRFTNMLPKLRRCPVPMVVVVPKRPFKVAELRMPKSGV
mmetsp:Transcript_46822/g.131685  ORF Transcript_46822/g.131685 Transcript_46822/m.131685 type:complete len:250 (-) Transcript_46822:443-1192(-)